METLNRITTFFVFNENGLISSHDLDNFCLDIQHKSKHGFKVLSKQDIDPNSTIYKEFYSIELDVVVYDQGYVLRIEGDVRMAIDFLNLLDRVIPNSKEFYVSPVQAIQNNDKFKYPRGVNIEGIGLFLDDLFNSKVYSSSLKDI